MRKYLLPNRTYNAKSFDKIKNNLFQEINNLHWGRDHKITISEVSETRTDRQNRMLQDMCDDVSKQVIWHERRLSQDEWRWMFVASYRKTIPIPNLDGDGFIILGQSSKKLSIKECNEVILLIESFGAEKGVNWTYNGPTYHESPIDPD